MNNQFKYSNTNKRYHTLDYYYKKRFNQKVFKVSLNAGFSCPNIDGTIGYGGCIYGQNHKEYRIYFKQKRIQYVCDEYRWWWKGRA